MISSGQRTDLRLMCHVPLSGAWPLGATKRVSGACIPSGTATRCVEGGCPIGLVPECVWSRALSLTWEDMCVIKKCPFAISGHGELELTCYSSIT